MVRQSRRRASTRLSVDAASTSACATMILMIYWPQRKLYDIAHVCVRHIQKERLFHDELSAENPVLKRAGLATLPSLHEFFIPF